MFDILKKFIQQDNFRPKKLDPWLPLIYTVYLLVLVLVFSYGLAPGQILPGYSEAEREVLEITSSLPSIVENFLHWPYYMAVYLLRFIVSDGVLAARIISLVAAAAVSAMFLYVLRRRFGLVISLAGVSFFALNSWILQLARSGTAQMTTLASVFLLICALILIQEKAHIFKLKLLALTAAIASWFTPLAPWLITALFIHIFYKHEVLKRILSLRLKFSLIASSVILCILMFLAFRHDQHGIFVAWGIPESINSLGEIVDNLLITLKAFIWQAPYNPQYWLVRLPFLDIFTAAMLPFGFYAVYQRPLGLRQRYLTFAALGLLFFVAINQGLQTSGIELILPLIIFVAIAGLNEFLNYWKRVFPLNPLAKVASVVIIFALVNMSLFYQVKRYFVAWSNHPQTQQIYNLKHK